MGNSIDLSALQVAVNVEPISKYAAVETSDAKLSFEECLQGANQRQQMASDVQKNYSSKQTKAEEGKLSERKLSELADQFVEDAATESGAEQEPTESKENITTAIAVELDHSEEEPADVSVDFTDAMRQEQCAVLLQQAQIVDSETYDIVAIKDVESNADAGDEENPVKSSVLTMQTSVSVADEQVISQQNIAGGDNSAGQLTFDFVERAVPLAEDSVEPVKSRAMLNGPRAGKEEAAAIAPLLQKISQDHSKDKSAIVVVPHQAGNAGLSVDPLHPQVTTKKEQPIENKPIEIDAVSMQILQELHDLDQVTEQLFSFIQVEMGEDSYTLTLTESAAAIKQDLELVETTTEDKVGVDFTQGAFVEQPEQKEAFVQKDALEPAASEPESISPPVLTENTYEEESKGKQILNLNTAQPHVLPIAQSQDHQIVDTAVNGLFPSDFQVQGKELETEAAPEIDQKFDALRDKMLKGMQFHLNVISTKGQVKEIQVGLTPAYLGKVQVKLQMDSEHKMVATLFVANQSAKELVQRSLPSLQKAFADRGIETRSMQVELSPEQKEQHNLSDGNRRFTSAEEMKQAKEWLNSFRQFGLSNSTGQEALKQSQNSITLDQLLDVRG